MDKQYGHIVPLNTKEEYVIPLKGESFQDQKHSESMFSREQVALLREEIKSLLEKGIISYCRESTRFFSIIFLVPKKNG